MVQKPFHRRIQQFGAGVPQHSPTNPQEDVHRPSSPLTFAGTTPTKSAPHRTSPVPDAPSPANYGPNDDGTRAAALLAAGSRSEADAPSRPLPNRNGGDKTGGKRRCPSAWPAARTAAPPFSGRSNDKRSEEHTSELQSRE